MYTQSMIGLKSLCQANGITLKEMFLFNESLIPRARNYVVDEFMRSGCTHLLFIDADISFDPEHVLQMLAIADPQSDYDILAGPYPKKTIAWEKIVHAVNRGMADEDPTVLENYVGDYVVNFVGGTDEIPVDSPVEVAEAGTGFFMVQRKAFEKFADAYPEYLYTPDHIRSKNFDGHRKIMAYFHCDIEPGSNRYLSEDYWFCHLARQAGMKVWLCPWIELAHMGNYIFGGSLIAMAQLGAPPTVDPSKLVKKKKKNVPTTKAEAI